MFASAKKLDDPRLFQIVTLSLLLAYGLGESLLDVSLLQVAVVITSAVTTQALFARWLAIGNFDWRSPLITGLSLSLLLRVNALELAMLAAVLAIGSKFLIRFNNKHIFNPANGALVLMSLSMSGAWTSPGQWGSGLIGGFAIACLGWLVLSRARRAETTLAFLCTWTALVCARALWLGDPLSIPLHQMGNGALLIFAFFMISDPKTTPDAALARVTYGSLVAIVGFVIQFVYFVPTGIVIALFFAAPLVPLLDWLLPSARYQWRGPSTLPSNPEDSRHESSNSSVPCAYGKLPVP